MAPDVEGTLLLWLGMFATAVEGLGGRTPDVDAGAEPFEGAFDNDGEGGV